MPPNATTVRPETDSGGRRHSPETRARLSEISRARWEALSPEQKAAQLARLKRRPPAPAGEPPPASEGGPRNPLDDAPGAPPEPARPVGRQGRTDGPPLFVVPDLPPLELGTDAGDQAGIAEQVPLAVTEAQVDRLLRLPFAWLATRRGRHWRLADDEAAMVVPALTAKINESALAARVLGAGGDWAVIVGGLAVIVSARVLEDQEHDQRARRDGRGRAAGVSPPVPGGDGDVGDRRDAGGPLGTLNGFILGGRPPDGGGAQAVDPEAPWAPPRQAL